MNSRTCTAPKEGHRPGSAEERKCPACGPRLTRQRKSLSAALPTGQNPEGVTAPQMIADWSDIHALRTAAAHPDAEVRAAVAANRFTPPSVLAQMSGDLSSRVRAEVGGNPKTPPRTLSRMARNGDEVSEVTERVAANPLTPQRSLTYLSKRATFWGEFHPSSVRAQVASNPAAPQTVLDRLVVDESPLVRRAALRYTRLPMNAVPRVDAGGDFDDMAALVLNPSLPQAVADRLASNPAVVDAMERFVEQRSSGEAPERDPSDHRMSSGRWFG